MGNIPRLQTASTDETDDELVCDHTLESYVFEQLMLCVWCTASADLPATWLHSGWANYHRDADEDTQYGALIRFYSQVFPYWVEFDDDHFYDY